MGRTRTRGGLPAGRWALGLAGARQRRARRRRGPDRGRPAAWQRSPYRRVFRDLDEDERAADAAIERVIAESRRARGARERRQVWIRGSWERMMVVALVVAGVLVALPGLLIVAAAVAMVGALVATIGVMADGADRR